MKQVSVKELCQELNLKEGSVRVWIKKPIQGVVFDASFVNNDEMRKKVLERMSDEEVIKKLGVSIYEVEITLNERTYKSYINFNEMKEGETYRMYNYSFIKDLKFVKDIEIEEGVTTYIFYNEKNDKYEIFKQEELNKSNIKFEVLD